MTPLLLVLTALATRVRYQDLPCPLGDDVVRVFTHISSNTQGGYDSDLAHYSSDGQFREYAVATCAENLFSLLGDDMTAPIDPDKLPALQAALAEEVAALPDPSNPTVWQRYGIAARMYQELGWPPLALAELYLTASWTVRDTVVGFHAGLEGPAAVKYLMAEGPAELERPLTDAQRKAVLYSLARVAHRGGYLAERDAWLERFAQTGTLSEEEQAAVAWFRRAVDEIEPHYQDLALAEFAAALADRSLPQADRIRARYLTADLLRRRGRPEEARPLFEEVAGDPEAPAELKSAASLLLNELP